MPPSVQVRAEYPGANPKVIAETVATPLEEAINGVENMMYMKSVAGSDGVLVIGQHRFVVDKRGLELRAARQADAGKQSRRELTL